MGKPRNNKEKLKSSISILKIQKKSGEMQKLKKSKIGKIIGIRKSPELFSLKKR
jgi:hypothetical protein